MYKTKTISVVKKEKVDHCFDFAEKIFNSKATSMKNHGNTSENLREKNDFIADIVRGKIAEYGFQQFLEENYQISFEVDLKIYEGEHNHDNGNDLATVYIGGEKHSFPYKTDIKGLPLKGQWLLVEDHKFWAQMFVVCRLHNIVEAKEFEKNPYLFKDKDFTVSILGYCLNKHIYNFEFKQPWFIFQQGQRLYSSKVIRQLNQSKVLSSRPSTFYGKLAKDLQLVDYQERFIGPELISKVNYGYPVRWLSNDWNLFVKIITQKSIVPSS